MTGSSELRILRKPETERRTGLSRTRIYELERDGKFPKRIKISERASGWVESEVDSWISQRVAESRSKTAA